MKGDVQNVYKAILQIGLQIKPEDLTPSEVIRQKNVIRHLLTENKAEILIDAIRFGMRNVWPYTELNQYGQPRIFSAIDLESKLLEAKAAASQVRRAGLIPYRPRRKG